MKTQKSLLKKFLLVLLASISSSSYGKDLTRPITITAKDIIAVDQLEMSTREDFDRYDGIFQIIIPKERFTLFRAPNCKKEIVIRPLPRYLTKKGINKEVLDRRWQLMQSFNAVVEGSSESITVSLDPEPYMKLNGNEPVLKQCNIFFAEEFWKTLKVK